jgi:hypothetical protein
MVQNSEHTVNTETDTTTDERPKRKKKEGTGKGGENPSESQGAREPGKNRGQGAREQETGNMKRKGFSMGQPEGHALRVLRERGILAFKANARIPPSTASREHRTGQRAPTSQSAREHRPASQPESADLPG